MSGRRRPKPLKSAWRLAQESRPQKMRQDCFDCDRVQPNPSELFDGAAATGAAATGTAATGTAATARRPPRSSAGSAPRASGQLSVAREGLPRNSYRVHKAGESKHLAFLKRP